MNDEQTAAGRASLPHRLEVQRREPAQIDDGELTHAYAALWKAAGGRDAAWHRPWSRALGVPEAA